jgi:hypothetical protein
VAGGGEHAQPDPASEPGFSVPPGAVQLAHRPGGRRLRDTRPSSAPQNNLSSSFLLLFYLFALPVFRAAFGNRPPPQPPLPPFSIIKPRKKKPGFLPSAMPKQFLIPHFVNHESQCFRSRVRCPRLREKKAAITKLSTPSVRRLSFLFFFFFF